MSTESLAALRKNVGNEYAELAQQHLQHDLKQEDRDRLDSAARTFSTFTTVGSVIGVGLGVLAAYRIRANRSRVFQALKATDKPTHVQFRDGRTQPIPDFTPMLKPSVLGDFATYTFFGAGGLFLGGELGVLSGGISATRTITSDPEAKVRIERAFRSFRADVHRREADKLENGQTPLGF